MLYVWGSSALSQMGCCWCVSGQRSQRFQAGSKTLKHSEAQVTSLPGAAGIAHVRSMYAPLSGLAWSHQRTQASGHQNTSSIPSVVERMNPIHITNAGIVFNPVSVSLTFYILNHFYTALRWRCSSFPLCFRSPF